MSRFFHFTIGPVQGFVAQARRTRDFWAGSFILSYLSAVAMKAVQVQGGKILFPAADENFLRCLTDPPKNRRDLPTQGGVPNRFKAEVDEGFDPEQVVETLRAAWRALADVVWRKDLRQVVEDGSFSATAESWQRQIESLWEIAWVVTPSAEASDVLDRRKNWRDHFPPAEPGIKCVVMDGWQELSGATRPWDPKLGEFWRAVQEKLPGQDLRDGEHLCALAFVKRRFARHFHRLRATMPGAWTLRGWKVPAAVPSTAYMAAVPWLEAVIRSEQVDSALLERFEKAARTLGGEYGEWQIDLKRLADAEDETGRKAHFFRSLDGSLFFAASLDNERIYPDRGQAAEVQKILGEIERRADVGPPSPFYAVLMMDGDSLGRHMSDVAKQPEISRALEKFTRKVQEIVTRQSGFLVYAGGDDVLALLSLDRALGCALALRDAYLECFAGTGIDSTLSGAIVYAHFKTPLTRVLTDAHELLDEVAKDERGRDALAVRVLTPGARVLEWSMPWERALEPATDDEEGSSRRIVLEALAEELAGVGADSDEAGESFSSGFFYRLRELFELINPRRGQHDDPGLSESEAVELMTAEYVVSGIHGDRRPSAEDVKPRVARLLDQCRPVTRRLRAGEPLPTSEWHTSRRLEPDGGLLARFLARKGVDA